MSHALLLLDYQEGLCRSDGVIGRSSGLGPQAEERGILQTAKRSLDEARSRGLNVFHVRVGFDSSYSQRTNRSPGFGEIEANNLLQSDSDEAQICHEVAPGPGEPVFVKGCVDPLVGTALRPALTVAGVDTLFLGGVATNFVVESVARHAGDAGFRVFVIDDMCASYTAEMHDFTMENIIPLYGEVISAAQVAELAEGPS